ARDELVREPNRRLAVFEHSRSIEPLALFVANLEQVAAGTEYGMLPELVADLDWRKGGDLNLHELLDAAHTILERLVDGVKDARAHGVPASHAEDAQAEGEHRQIPDGETNSNGPESHGPSLSRSVYPNPRTV